MLDLLDKISKIVENVSTKEGVFVDVRIEKVNVFHIERNPETVRVREGQDLGAAVRVFGNGVWGFTSTVDVSPESIEKAIIQALKIVRVRQGDLKIKLLDPREDYVKPVLKVDFRDVDPEVKMRDLEEYYKMLREPPCVKSCTVYYSDVYITKMYVSSDGRKIVQELAYTWLYTWITGSEAGQLTAVRDERGTRDGYTLWKKWPPEELSKKIRTRLEGQLRGVKPKAGKFPVVMAPEVVGVFAHEVFGHLAEADITMSGSIIKDKIGQKIGNDLVTIIDDPNIEGGFGTIKYDDEGAEARPAVLVENGYVKELMVDRTYAALLNVELTGNARAESFRVTPLIRMRNTIFKPGDMKFEELIEDIKFGYYLVSFRGGEANFDGTFQVGIQEAYEIVNGEIGKPVKNMSISGNVLDVLNKVTGVGKDFDLEYGRCGKGQIVYVSSGGPHVRVEEMLIGGLEQ